MNKPAPRVFVSSVIDGFETFRRAAKEAISRAGGIPVLVNEDSPSLRTSSRNACLDAVDSSDIFILVIGERGGWRAPSGKLVIEEEFERARKRKQSILVFVKDSARDSDAEQLVKSISDYVSGYFRATFRTENDLKQAVERALRPIMDSVSKPTMNTTELSSLLKVPHKFRDEASLRLVLGPERQEEVIDPVDLDSAEFLSRVYAIGHEPSVGLLNYRHPKDEQVSSTALIIHQEPSGHRQSGFEGVHLEVRTSGLVIIDSNITGRAARTDSSVSLNMFVIAEADLESVLSAEFRFCASLYQALDPYQRHERFLYDVALSGIGYRHLEKNPQPRSSYAMGMRTGDGSVLVAFETARLVDRSSLSNPADEVRRVIAVLARNPNLR